MGVGRNLLLWASRNSWLQSHVPRWWFVRRARGRFMPGEDLAAAAAAAEELSRHGIGTVLTYLGENVTTQQEAAGVAGEYLAALEAIGAAGLDAQLSIKLTQLGLDLGVEPTVRLLETIVSRATEGGVRVWIDMEDSTYVDVTLDIYGRLRARHTNVGICLQSYLRRTGADLDRLIRLGPAIRLVKGAYRESADIAFSRKAEVDAAYAELARRMMDTAVENGLHLVLGTHDPVLIEQLRVAESAGEASAAALEFHMLYGIRAAAQRQLAGEGCRVRVLISYGRAWYPWYMRRLAERPANVWFVVKNILVR